MSDAEIAAQIAGGDADLILTGHTHIPFERHVDGVCVVNPGSVSNPFPPDLRASYAVLEAGPIGYTVEHRRVDYDREAVIEAMRRLRYPTLDYVSRHLRGEVTE
jgi:predicted phosphodiesterase